MGILFIEWKHSIETFLVGSAIVFFEVLSVLLSYQLLVAIYTSQQFEPLVLGKPWCTSVSFLER
jgi:hypothetical protein